VQRLSATRLRILAPLPPPQTQFGLFRQRVALLGKRHSRRNSFINRVTPQVLTRVPDVINTVFLPTPADLRRTRLRSHLGAFSGDIPSLLASYTLTLRPSSTRTYCATLRAMRPDAREVIDRFMRQAQLAMSTPRGKPRGAVPPDFPLLCQHLARAPPLIANTLKTMFVTASRHQDLAHFSATCFDGTWRIELIPRDQLGKLIGPKSDQDGAKHLVKWVPVSPLFDPQGPWASYDELYQYMKAHLHTSPHSVRRLAVQMLERKGFTTSQIASLTNHYDSVAGMSAYRQRLPVDPPAQMSRHISSCLVEELQSSLAAIPMSPTSSSGSLMAPIVASRTQHDESGAAFLWHRLPTAAPSGLTSSVTSRSSPRSSAF
jgi:hypothetical protein